MRLVIDAALAPSLTLMKQQHRAPTTPTNNDNTSATIGTSTLPLSVIRAACKLLQTTRGSGLHTVLARVRAGKGDTPVGQEGVGGEGSSGGVDRELHQALLETTPMLRDIILGCFINDNDVPSLVSSGSGEEGGTSATATRSWFSACEEAMHALFHSHPCPDKVMTYPLNTYPTVINHPIKHPIKHPIGHIL